MGGSPDVGCRERASRLAVVANLSEEGAVAPPGRKPRAFLVHVRAFQRGHALARDSTAGSRMEAPPGLLARCRHFRTHQGTLYCGLDCQPPGAKRPPLRSGTGMSGARSAKWGQSRLCDSFLVPGASL